MTVAIVGADTLSGVDTVSGSTTFGEGISQTVIGAVTDNERFFAKVSGRGVLDVTDHGDIEVVVRLY